MTPDTILLIALLWCIASVPVSLVVARFIGFGSDCDIPSTNDERN